MKVVYHCYGGAHASPTAAAIHLGYISDHRRPSFHEISDIPFFDHVTANEHGHLIKAGVDRWGNEIYILGRRGYDRLVINLIKEFTRLTGGDPSQYYFVNCLQVFNLIMATGGYSSRGMGWVKFGRPIVALGTMFSFRALVSIVHRTIREIELIQNNR